MSYGVLFSKDHNGETTQELVEVVSFIDDSNILIEKKDGSQLEEKIDNILCLCNKNKLKEDYGILNSGDIVYDYDELDESYTFITVLDENLEYHKVPISLLEIIG